MSDRGEAAPAQPFPLVVPATFSQGSYRIANVPALQAPSKILSNLTTPVTATPECVLLAGTGQSVSPRHGFHSLALVASAGSSVESQALVRLDGKDLQLSTRISHERHAHSRALRTLWSAGRGLGISASYNMAQL